MTAPPPPPANPNWPPPAHPSPYPQPSWVLPTSGYTPWARRALALGIDMSPVVLVLALPFAVMEVMVRSGCDRCARSSYEILGHLQPAIFFLLIPVYLLWNFGHRQGKSGSSLGKAVLKFKVVSEKTWQPIGFWASVGRLAAHYVDQLLCFVGFLWPLWDARRQTLADKIMSTVCVPVR